MSRYTVQFERDDSGWWVAQVKEVPAAITQGRTIVEARRRIREALALALDDDKNDAAIPTHFCARTDGNAKA